MQPIDDDEIDLVGAVYDALDAGDPAAALAMTRRALAAVDEDDSVLQFLAGVALLELDRPDEAALALSAAARLDPEDAEFRARLAEAHFRACRFDEAEREARRAVELDAQLPHGHDLHGLLLERRGLIEDADRAFARASELDPQAFPAAVRLTREEFEAHLRRALEELPSPFREEANRVVIGIEPVPPDDLLTAEAPPIEPDLLGLFVGVPRTEQSSFSPGGELPPRIYLFQRNLEREAADRDDLVEQIGVTLRHELGHYLGLDEDEIEAAGHA